MTHAVAAESSPAPEVALGIVRGISHGLFRPAEPFGAQLRALGAGLVRIFIYWSQVEPEPGRYDFGVVDSFLEELDGTEQVWITLCSSSPWATRQATRFLPPSPAKDPAAYRALVARLVAHCAGRVRYWQCDNEPSNVGLTWAGTAEEYLDQLRVMHRAVKDTDPRAAVVLGGAPFNIPASAPDSDERRFFDVLLRDGRDHFDCFDLHLYADADAIPRDIDTVRGMMRAFGYQRPVLIGEYGAPTPEQFPEAQAAIMQAMSAAFAGAAPALNLDPQPGAADAPAPPDRAAVQALYRRMNQLPPTLQMFMAGCAPKWEARRARIHCREIVMRNLQALSAGARVTACWKLAPEVSGYEDPYSIMELFYGKLLLMDYAGATLRRKAAADTFALMAERLRGVERVERIAVPDRPALRLFEVHRPGRGPLLVAWIQGDPVSGEEQPPQSFTWDWPAARARAVDALGQPRPCTLQGGQLSLSLSVTPLFVDAAEPGRAEFRGGASEHAAGRA